MLKDGLENIVANIATEKDKASAWAWAVDYRSPLQYEAMYRGGWLGRKIVDIPVDDMTREWRSWSADAPLIEKINEAEKKFAVREKVQTAKRWARLFGSSAIVLGVSPRLGRPDEPLDLARMSANDLNYLHVEISPYLTIRQWETDLSNPNFGKPQLYSYNPFRHGATGLGQNGNPTSVALQIHASRVIPFAGMPLPPYAALQGKSWGDSVFAAIEQTLNTAGGVTAVIASLLTETKVDVIKTDLSGLATADGEDRIKKRFALASMLKSVNNTLLLGKEEEYDQKTFTWSGLSDIHMRIMQEISGAADIPVTRLLGQTPAGLQSTGEGDLRNYYDGIRAKQESELRPQLEILDRALFASDGITLPKGAEFTWRPLWQPTAKEKAENAHKKAQATQIYANLGLFDDEAFGKAVASQLVEDHVYPGLDAALKGGEIFADPDEMDGRAERDGRVEKNEVVDDWRHFEDDGFNQNQPRVPAGSENGGQWVGGGGEISKEDAKKAYEDRVVPPGWFVHGRSAKQQGSIDPLDTGFVIQMTADFDVADSYAGDTGSIWIIKPKEDAVTLNLSHLGASDFSKIAKAFRDDFHSKRLPFEIESWFDNDLGVESAWRTVKQQFAPNNIVESAGAYDNPSAVAWLYEKTGAEFVETPDGAVAIDISKMKRLRVSRDGASLNARFPNLKIIAVK